MNFCPEIYKGLFLNPRKNNVTVAPCCQSLGTEVVEFDFHTNNFLQRLRSENAIGTLSNECKRCWDIEKSGGTSKRQSSVQFSPGTDTTTELQNLEYNITWACNLACIMCGPQCSSTWAKELGLDSTDNIARKHQTQVVDSLDLSNLKRVHFNGGEPFINNDHVKLLAKIKHINDCKISYNTNGTIMPSKTAIKLWEKSHVVRLFFSIDATKNAFEYIRFPAKWQKVTENIIRMKQYLPDNVMFGFNVTVGSYNLLEIESVYKWFENTLATNRTGEKSNFHWQVADNFHYRDLPELVKIQALEQLQDCKPLESLYNSVSDCLNTIPNGNWIEKLDTLDARRQTNWRTALKIGQYYK